MIYLKEKPDELKETLEKYPDARRYLLHISNYKAIDEMNITNVSEVSFNCQCPRIRTLLIEIIPQELSNEFNYCSFKKKSHERIIFMKTFQILICVCMCMHMIAHINICTYGPIFQFVRQELACFLSLCQEVYLSSQTKKMTLFQLKEVFWM